MKKAHAIPPLVAATAALLTLPATAVSPVDRSTEPVSIDELRVPASPAFVLLGISPTAVERPGSPRAFALSAIAATERSDSAFPQDLAVEFAPYWWSSHPSLTFDDYYLGKRRADGTRRRRVRDTILRSLAFSIATVDLEDQTEVQGTRGAVGFRFLLLPGEVSPEVESFRRALQDVQVEVLQNCVPDDPEEPVDEDCVAGFDEGLKAAAADLREAVGQGGARRAGWTLELAGAVTADFPDDDARRRETSRTGTWLTASYRSWTRDEQGRPTRASNLAFVLVGRHLRDDTADLDLDKSDVGARLVWSADPEVMPPLSFSLEYVRRFVSSGEGADPDDTDRLAAVLEYRTPLEDVTLVASYGKEFADDFTGKEDLITTLGINVGFGRGPTVRIPDLWTVARGGGD